ncbi:TPR-like protein [Gonapodya prolifera JEL478]|uniref:TPR-like protein n=1 Tax=Gonapodya prolifera (strain JEL478) TaxID=1344416 RepID=A0A139AYL7_GONPJ|nr:TPR-like protein [Gonapodya prolifera JEL478]|eukprot:KXS21807.1 TPR-like protein [Gonapodya prolifera JEL478]
MAATTLSTPSPLQAMTAFLPPKATLTLSHPALVPLQGQLGVARSLLDDDLAESALTVTEMIASALWIHVAKPSLSTSHLESGATSSMQPPFSGVSTTSATNPRPLTPIGSSSGQSGGPIFGSSVPQRPTVAPMLFAGGGMNTAQSNAAVQLLAIAFSLSGEALFRLNRHAAAITRFRRALDCLGSHSKTPTSKPVANAGTPAPGETNGGPPDQSSASQTGRSEDTSNTPTMSVTEAAQHILTSCKEMCARSEAAMSDWTSCCKTILSIPEQKRSGAMLRLLARSAEIINDIRLAYSTHLTILDRQPCALESYTAIGRLAQSHGTDNLAKLPVPGNNAPAAGAGTEARSIFQPTPVRRGRGRGATATASHVAPMQSPHSVGGGALLTLTEAKGFALFKALPRLGERLGRAKELAEWYPRYVGAQVGILEGSWEAALQLLNPLTRSNPDCIPVHAAVGECEYQLGHTHAAWLEAIKIRKIDPCAVEFMDRYADLMSTQKDLVGLNHLSTSLTATTPTPPRPSPIPSYVLSRYCTLRSTYGDTHPLVHQIGEPHEEHAQRDAAGWRERAALNAEMCAKGEGEVWYTGWGARGSIALAQGKIDEAITFYTKAKTRGGGRDVAVLQGLATAFLHQKRWPEVSRLAAELQRAMPNNPRALVVVGVVRASAGMNMPEPSALREKKEAIDVLKRALELDPKSVEAVVALSSALLNAQELKEAIEMVESKLLFHNTEFMHVRLGDLLVLDNQPERAMEHYNRALRLDPMSEGARNGLKRLDEAEHGHGLGHGHPRGGAMNMSRDDDMDDMENGMDD